MAEEKGLNKTVKLKADLAAFLGASSLSRTEITKKERIVEARDIQGKRFAGRKIYANAQMSVRDIRNHCDRDLAAERLLVAAVEKWALSPRAYHRVLKVARTISDLEGHDIITEAHIAEALRYRVLDKKLL